MHTRLLRAEVLTVKADTTRLKQVILNLLSNAIKYNQEEGRCGYRRSG